MDINLRTILVLVIFTSVLGQIATDIYLPSLPSLENLFEVESNLIKISISIFFSGYAISQIICGPLSDQYGRKYFMLCGVIIFGMGCCIAANSTCIETLIGARIVQGLGSGCFGVANRAILYDSFSGINYSKSISLVGIVMAVSPMLAPCFGGVLHEYYGWQSIFLFMQLYAIILFLLLFGKLPETITFKNTSRQVLSTKQFFHKLILGYREVMASKYFWNYGLINMLGFAAFIMYLGSASFLIQNHLGYSSIEYGKFISVLSVGYIAGGLISNKLINTRSRTEIIQIGNQAQMCSVMMYMIFYLTGITPLMTILIPMVVFVLGTGMINPNSTAQLISNFPNYAATAAAAMGALMTCGTFVVTSLVFIFLDNSVLALGGNLLIFALSIRFLIRRENYELATVYEKA